MLNNLLAKSTNVSFVCFTLFFCVVLIASTSEIKAQSGSVITYPVPSGIPRSTTFSVSVNGTPVTVEKFQQDINVARFAFTGQANITITYLTGNFNSFTLSPINYNISTNVSGNTLRFSLTNPRKLILHRVSGTDQKLFIIADAPEVDPISPQSTNVINLANFGIDSNGGGDVGTNTSRFQSAIDQASNSRGVLYVPPGIYRTNRLTLRSNMTLYLAPGAFVRAASYGFAMYLIGDNITVRGRGTIDGIVNSLHLFGGDRNNNIRLSDVTFLNNAAQGVYFTNVSNLVMDNINIFTDNRNYGSDGLDLDTARMVRANKLLIYSGDDCIAFHAGSNNGTEDIVFTDGVYYNTFSGSVYKWANIDTMPYIRNITFSNETMVYAPTHPIAFVMVQGALAENITFNNIYLERGPKNFDFITRPRDYWTSTNNNVPGEIRNITFNNFFSSVRGNPSTFSAEDPNRPIRNIYFNNFRINGNLILDAQNANFNYVRNVRDIYFSSSSSITPVPSPSPTATSTPTLTPTRTSTKTPTPTISPPAPTPFCNTINDLNCDGKINIEDINILLQSIGKSNKQREDLDRNGIINTIDLAIIVYNYNLVR